MPFLRKLLLLGLAVIATVVATPAYANIYARVTFNTYSEYRAWGDAALTGNPGPAYFTIFRANVPNAGNDYVAVPGNIVLSGNVTGQLVDLGTTGGYFTANLSNNAGYQANGCVVSPIDFFTSIHANNGDTFDITITCRPPPPVISGLAPNTGSSAGGTSVVITGSNLSGATAVRFGGTNATGYVVNGSTQITATAPAGTGTVDVTVTTAGGTSATSAADRFTYQSAPVPTVTGITPTSGPTAGGTTVVITGTNLIGATAVRFGGTNATGYTVNGSTQITATAPAGTGTVDVTVTTAGGTSATSAADRFTYLAPPVAGPVSVTVAYGSANNPVTLDLGGGAATSVAIGTAAANGTAQAIGTSIVYTPAAGYAGPDSFTYTATNASGTSAPATVTVTVGPPTIIYAPASPAAAVVGVAYSQSLAGAGGGTGPYTYAITSGALPAGMALAANGVLSGTPTMVGNYSFRVTATDSSTGTGPFSAISAALTLAVVAPTISVSPASLPGATVGVAYTQALAASGGAAPYSYAIVAGALPPGLSLSQDGVLSGTPTAAGTFNISLTATDANAFTGSHPYVLTVAAPTITLDPTSLANGQIGASYSQTISASGGTAPYSHVVTSGTLPTGLTLSAGGVLSGTPTAAGTFNFTVSATDSSTGAGPFNGSRSYNVSILSPALTLVPATLTGLAVGSAHTSNIVAGGGTGPYNYFMYGGTVLPAGMSLSADGTLSGTPTAAGSYSFTIAATDSSTGTGAPFTVARAYNVTVGAPTLALAPAALPAATASVAYSQALSTSGGTSPYSYAVTSGALPAGMTLSAGGALSGTPTATGTFNFTVTATDSSGGTGPFTASQAYTLQVDAPPLTAGAVSATVGYGAAATPVTLDIVGTPTSVAVASAPVHGTVAVSGTTITYAPAAGYAGADSFTYTASDGYSTTAAATVSITVSGPTLAIATATLADAIAGSAYAQTLAATGGAAPYSYAVTAGVLPAGVALSPGGELSGTPTATGSFNFTVTATDSSSGTGPFSASHSYTLQVDAPALTAGAVSATVGYGAAATPVTLDIVGTPTSVAVASAPVHGTVAVSGTTITYAPAAGYAGADSFTYTASDAYSTSAPAAVSITVSAPALALAPGSLPAAIAGNAYAQTLAATGGAAPYSYAVTAGVLPAGVALSPGGELSGTPTATGSFSFTVTATDSSSGTGPFSASHSYTLQVDAPALTAGAVSATVGYGAAATPVALDIAGTPTSVAVASAPVHGTVAVSGTTITYAPAAGYAGADSFTYTASDAYSTSAPATVSITVSAPTVVIATATLADAVAGSAYAQTLAASGGAAPYRYAVTAGALPAGVTLSAAGELAGTPTVAGTFTVTVAVTDSSTGTGPFTASRGYTLQVDAPAITVGPGTLPDAMGASDYRQTFTASGGVAPYRFTVLGGDLPAGLVLAESGELAGTPTAAGRHAFTVQAADANGFTGSQAYTVMVEAAAQAIEDFVATPVEPVYAPGASFSVSARGGASGNPVVFAATTPAVCSVQGGTVTMLAAGVCSLTADQAGNAVYQAAPQVRLDVAIAAATPVLSWLADLGKVFGEDDFDLPDPQSNSPGAFTFTSSDAAVATVSGRTVHLVGEGTAVLVATQAASGSYTTASVQVQLVVSARPDPTTDAQVTGGLQAQVDAAVRFAQVQQANIRDRLRQVRNGHNPSSNNLTLAYAGSEHMPGLSVPVGQAAAGTIPAMPQGWGVWLAGTATFGTSGRNGSSGGAFDFDTGGITLGADRAFGERTLLGMAASWGRQGTDFDGTPSKVDADQRSLAVYGLWRAGEHLFLDGMLATGRLDYELARWSEVAGATAHARRDGDQWFGSLTFGYEHRNASGMSLTGYGRYDGHRSDLDAYAESGLGLYDLAYGRQRVDNSALALGLEGDHPFKRGSASWRPFWTVEYRVALENQSDVAINYVQRPLGNDYTLAMRSYNDDTLALGAGMDLQLDSGWMFSLLLGHEQGRNSLRSNSIGLRLSFGSQPGAAPVYVDEPGLGYEDAGRERCRGDGARCDARGSGH